MKKMYPTVKWSINAPKIFLLCAMVFTIALTTISCSKDDSDPKATVYPEENPLDGYLTNSGFNQKVINYVNSGNYEFGIVFSPNVNGKIKALTVKLPDVNNSLKVTFWDATTQAVIRTELISVTSSNTLVTKAISELALEKDKKYAITMNSQDYYIREKTDQSDATYPVTSGNLKIWEYRWEAGATQIYPTTVDNAYYAGDLSFVFQQTN